MDAVSWFVLQMTSAALMLSGTLTISSTLGKGTTASAHAGLERRCGVRKQWLGC